MVQKNDFENVKKKKKNWKEFYICLFDKNFSQA